jgi:adenylate cyclase
VATEIERKFLVTGKPQLNAKRSIRIEQGYLCSEPEIRIRTQQEGKQKAAVLTVKLGQGIVRQEFEYSIPSKDAAILLSRTNGIIKKTRYICTSGGQDWEVDEYDAPLAPLVTAELELSDASEVFEYPDWLGEEITGRKEFGNYSLAINGLPKSF